MTKRNKEYHAKIIINKERGMLEFAARGESPEDAAYNALQHILSKANVFVMPKDSSRGERSKCFYAGDLLECDDD